MTIDTLSELSLKRGNNIDGLTLPVCFPRELEIDDAIVVAEPRHVNAVLDHRRSLIAICELVSPL